MQQPTLESVRIRSTRDALQVFYGVATNKIPLIIRRLDAEERRAIVAGNVYVWEERGANTEPIGIGMERCQEKLSQLRTIDSVRGIGNVSVPDGLFRSARANKARRDTGVEVSLPGTSLLTETVVPSVILPLSPRGHSGAITHSSYPRSSIIAPIKTTMTPSTSSSSSSSTSSPVLIHTPTTTPPKQLVPLLYLQNNTSPRRDPADEQLLRRFNTLSSRGSHQK
ncbi:hypothetical protein HHX47_DHR4000727 [Lentinula edodes]|nr:hypothetical protein HHX47_DHR4000727 [Lentinula edodes]